MSTPAPGRPGWLTEVPAGLAGAATLLALVLTLGLLAFGALGPTGARVGIPAALVAAIVGPVVLGLALRHRLLGGGPSTAMTLITMSLVAQLVQAPGFDAGAPGAVAGLAGVVALTVCTMGLLQWAMGWLGLGRLAHFVPQPVLAGFMTGVAALILLAQWPLLLGLPLLAFRDHGWAAWQAVRPLSLLVGLLTLACAAGMAWRWPRRPTSLLALALGSALYLGLQWAWPTAPLGPLTGALPAFQPWPDALAPLLGSHGWARVRQHAPAILTAAALLALVGALETVLNSLAVAQSLHQRSDPDRELKAAGLANLVSGVFGGLPVVVLRTLSTSVTDARGRSGIAIAATGAWIALAAWLAMPLLEQLPRAALAGIMILLGWRLVDPWSLRMARRWLRGERSADSGFSLAVVGLVAGITVLWGFVAAVGVGLLLSMVWFIRTMNRSLLRAAYPASARPSRRVHSPDEEDFLGPARRRILVLELQGALFFGSGDRLAREVAAAMAGQAPPADSALTRQVLVLDFRRVTTIDPSGARELAQVARELGAGGTTLLLAGVSAQEGHGLGLLQSGAFDPAECMHWFADIDRATEAAEGLLLADAQVDAAATAAVPLLASDLALGLSAAQGARLADCMPERRFAAGATLFGEGDPADRLFVLSEGQVSVLNHRPGQVPGDQRYATLGPGRVLGEMAMLDGGGRSARAVADSGLRVFELRQDSLAELQQQDPQLAGLVYRNLALHLAQRLRSAGSAWREAGD